MNSSASHALKIPEILTHILENGNYATLNAATLVNKLWFECAFPIFWQHGDALKLANVPDADRRQMYASQMTVLVFVVDDLRNSHDRLMDLDFPKLKKLELDHCGASHLFLHYLRPKVEHLVLNGVDWFSSQFDDAAKVVGHLKTIEFDCVGWHSSSAAIASFLKHCKCLETALLFNIGDDEDFEAADCVVALATLHRLEKLNCVLEITEDAVHQITKNVPQPFARLRWLSSHVQSAAVSIFWRLVPNLTYLDLYIPEGSEDLQNISNLKNLRNLSLRQTHGSIGFTRRQLMALASLHNLEHLVLYSPGPPPQQDALLSDADFTHIISTMPRLEALTVEHPSPLTVASLCALAQHCPRVVSCSISHLMIRAKQLEVAKPVVSSTTFCESLHIETFERIAWQDEGLMRSVKGKSAAHYCFY